jgi:hypothetical protein
MSDERKESKFMKEWKKSYASLEIKSGGNMSENDVCRRFNILAEILDKCLIEIEEEIKRSFLQETLMQRFRRTGK